VARSTQLAAKYVTCRRRERGETVGYGRAILVGVQGLHGSSRHEVRALHDDAMSEARDRAGQEV
jgi:hypothetical protein